MRHRFLSSSTQLDHIENPELPAETDQLRPYPVKQGGECSGAHRAIASNRREKSSTGTTSTAPEGVGSIPSTWSRARFGTLGRWDRGPS